MYQFYAPDIEQTLFLPEEESLHCAKVLRLIEGTLIAISDGNGNRFVARIIRAHSTQTHVEIIEKQYEIRNETRLTHIAIAPTKNRDRMEWFVEKVTEIGVDIITPVFCHFSERKNISQARLEKIAIAAMKQSQRAYLPKLNVALSLHQLLEQTIEKQRYIAHCYEEEKTEFKKVYTPDSNAIVLIGPEGDFTREEVKEALRYGFLPVSLGDNRLRTETAGIVACHTMQLLRCS
jgi:16S rRNA (uracil1498-N3)-methyltransferase